MRRTALFLLAVTAFAAPAAAQEGCAALLGTYLTQKAHDAGTDPNTVGRSLLALIPGGLAAWTDSNQSGGEGWQGFTEARGGWSCDGTSFTALVFDFTHETEALPGQQIARIDVSGTVDGEDVTGEATVLFYPLGADPFDDEAGTNAIRYAFTGQRIAP